MPGAGWRGGWTVSAIGGGAEDSARAGSGWISGGTDDATGSGCNTGGGANTGGGCIGAGSGGGGAGLVASIVAASSAADDLVGVGSGSVARSFLNRNISLSRFPRRERSSVMSFFASTARTMSHMARTRGTPITIRMISTMPPSIVGLKTNRYSQSVQPFATGWQAGMTVMIVGERSAEFIPRWPKSFKTCGENSAFRKISTKLARQVISR